MLEWLARYWLEVLFSGVLAGGGYLIRRLWKKQQEKSTSSQYFANHSSKSIAYSLK